MLQMSQKLTIYNKIILLILLAVFLIMISSVALMEIERINYRIVYTASEYQTVKLYNKDYQEVMTMPRGQELKVSTLFNQQYYQIMYNKEQYFINQLSVVNNLKAAVMEHTMYVRTPVTLSLEGGLSLIKKGEQVTIIGYDKLNVDGSVNRYQVSYNNLIGFVMAKYFVNTKELALLNYDQAGTYLIHTKRGDTLGGGSGANLDFYPYTKPSFTDNVMPKETRCLYLNGGTIRRMDDYIVAAKSMNINAIVVDIKDNVSPAYASPAMQKYSPTSYNHAFNTFENYQTAIKKLKDNGFYVIGRITVFKDQYYSLDHPEHTILDNTTGLSFDHNGAFWPSAFKREVWEYNIALAKEAVAEMGFNEIQFDYVRFPDRTNNLEKAGKMNLRNTYNEDKAQAIQGFVMYAADELHQVGAYISVDVFGESAHNYVTAYGQYWGAISNVVDVISPMPYPDHFSAHEYDFEEVVWTVPYKVLSFWASNYVVKRQLEIPTPAKVRTWIQAFNTSKEPAVEYGVTNVSEEIKALYDAGLRDGFMPWNSGSKIDKYYSLAEAFKKEY